MADSAVIVHTLEDALTALEAADAAHVPVTLQSAPDAIHYAGSLYLLHLFEQAKACHPRTNARFVLDCGEAGAEAIGAMQIGHKVLRSSAQNTLRAKLKDIAQQLGAELVETPVRTLDMAKAHNPAQECREWLTQEH